MSQQRKEFLAGNQTFYLLLAITSLLLSQHLRQIADLILPSDRDPSLPKETTNTQPLEKACFMIGVLAAILFLRPLNRITDDLPIELTQSAADQKFIGQKGKKDCHKKPKAVPKEKKVVSSPDSSVTLASGGLGGVTLTTEQQKAILKQQQIRVLNELTGDINAMHKSVSNHHSNLDRCVSTASDESKREIKVLKKELEVISRSFKKSGRKIATLITDIENNRLTPEEIEQTTAEIESTHKKIHEELAIIKSRVSAVQKPGDPTVGQSPSARSSRFMSAPQALPPPLGSSFDQKYSSPGFRK